MHNIRPVFTRHGADREHLILTLLPAAVKLKIGSRFNRMSYQFSAVIEKEGRWYVALCPQLDVASQGRSIEEALGNLKEAVELFLQNASKSEIKGALGSHPLITTLEVTV